jgi:molecular chaperone GrpE
MSTPSGPRHGPDRPMPVVLRDQRRIGPTTLQPWTTGRGRHPRSGPAPPSAGAGPPAAPPAAPPSAPPGGAPGTGGTEDLQARLAERTADLQRVKAEYDNYRKQVRRDRMAVREIAVANVLRGLLPVLDAVALARDHGEVTGGFAAVTEDLESRLAELGLQAFGEEGEPFDPTRHEAITRVTSASVSGPTCTQIFRCGYRVGDQLLRPAEVVVAEPGEPGDPAESAGPTEPAPPASA